MKLKIRSRFKKDYLKPHSHTFYPFYFQRISIQPEHYFLAAENEINLKNDFKNTKRLKNYMFEGLYLDVNRTLHLRRLTLIFFSEKPLSNKIKCKP
ncbi:hypothetical protein RSJ42_13785 [Methanosarcina hadiensis]|uniref:hypothetical protein n=1 Tax=Methanosarcina hadiensis TaxID=3078083 RepID=UPI0039777218